MTAILFHDERDDDAFVVHVVHPLLEEHGIGLDRDVAYLNMLAAGIEPDRIIYRLQAEDAIATILANYTDDGLIPTVPTVTWAQIERSRRIRADYRRRQLARRRRNRRRGGRRK